MNETLMLVLAAIAVVGILCQYIAWWLRIPAILWLLLAGFFMGPVTGFLDPDLLFGELLFPLVSLGVAVILFEGALTLKIHEIKDTATVIPRLVTLGMIATWIVSGIAAYHFVDLSWPMAFLFGALVTVTGPTVIVPMLRFIRPNERVANILRWEGIVIDPIGAMVALLVFEYINTGPEEVGWAMSRLLAYGTIVGLIGAYVTAFLMRRHLIPDYLLKITILVFVIAAFTISNLLQEEAGLLAVTVMGIVLTNIKGVKVDEILDFKEALTILIISLLFIILAARIDIAPIVELGWGSLLVLGVIIFIARPICILVSTCFSSVTWKERILLSWIGPRGIVAAAITSILAIKLETNGVPQAEILTPLVFIVIIGTVVIQSLTATSLAQFLGLADPEPRGILIVGGNPLAQAIGLTLHNLGFNIMIADTSWDNIRDARMKGLKTFYGNVVSEYADRHLELTGIGKLLAVSQRPAQNALASLRYRREFGSNNVFIVKTDEEKFTPQRDYISRDWTAPFLFGKDITQSRLASRLAQGHRIHNTTLTEEFSYDDYLKKYGSEALPLFAIDRKKQLRPYLVDQPLKPETGWTILSLIPPSSKDDTVSE